MKVIDQNIPSLLLQKYKQIATVEKLIRGEYYITKRYPFKLPKLGKYAKLLPSYAGFKATCSPLQRVNRATWQKCVNCFKLQPETGGVEPPVTGYRNRSWWYDQAQPEGMWYYNYFMRETFNVYITDQIPVWCRAAALDAYVIDSEDPTEHYNDWPEVAIGEYYSGMWRRYWIYMPAGYTKINIWLMGTYEEDFEGDTLQLKFYKSDEAWTGSQPSWNDGPFDTVLFHNEEFTDFTQCKEKWIQVEVPTCHSIMLDVAWKIGPGTFIPSLYIAANDPGIPEQAPYWSN